MPKLFAGIETWFTDHGLIYKRFGFVKYSSDGNRIWHGDSLVPGTPLEPKAFRVLQEGSCLMLGTISSANPNLTKMDAPGNRVWDTFFYMDVPGGTSSASDANAFALDQNSNAYLVGGRNKARLMVGKIDSAGNRIWTYAYTNAVAGLIEGLGIASVGSNIFVAGYAPRTATDSDIFLFKYDQDGNRLAEARFDSAHHGSEVATAMVADAAGNIYVTGYGTTVEGGTEIILIKYSEHTRIERQQSGSVSLEFHAEPGASFAIEGTTNFFDWAGISTNVADGFGIIRFEDTNTFTIPFRFYRGAVVP
jgi:hypothetical protein